MKKQTEIAVSIAITVVVLLGIFLGIGLLFRNFFFATYEDVGKGLQNLQKTNLDDILTGIQKGISLPPPLNAGGAANNQTFTKARIIAQTNIQRYNNDLRVPLIENVALSQAAQAKVEDMFENQYFDHNSPSGAGPGDLVKQAGYDYIVSGENLILGNFASEAAMVQAWMDSPGHRANILNNRFTEIGVAVMKGNYKGQTVWMAVQEFGLPLTSCPQPDESIKQRIDADTITLDQLFADLERKKAELDQTNKKSQQYNQMVNEYNNMVEEYNALAANIKVLISRYNVQVNTFNACVEGEEPGTP